MTDKVCLALGDAYETAGDPECHQWPIYEWDENEVGHGMWLICESGRWSVEYQVEGVGAFVVDYPSEEGILEWIKLK